MLLLSSYWHSEELCSLLSTIKSEKCLKFSARSRLLSISSLLTIFFRTFFTLFYTCRINVFLVRVLSLAKRIPYLPQQAVCVVVVLWKVLSFSCSRSGGELLLASCSQDCLIRVWRLCAKSGTDAHSEDDHAIIKMKEDIFEVNENGEWAPHTTEYEMAGNYPNV